MDAKSWFLISVLVGVLLAPLGPTQAEPNPLAVSAIGALDDLDSVAQIVGHADFTRRLADTVVIVSRYIRTCTIPLADTCMWTDTATKDFEQAADLWGKGIDMDNSQPDRVRYLHQAQQALQAAHEDTQKARESLNR